MLRCARFFGVFLVAVGIFPQTNRATPPVEESFRKIGLRVATQPDRARSSREFRLRLQSAARSTAARLIQSADRSDPPPKQRSPELSADHLVIAILDKQAVVRYWQTVIDPRL